MEQLKNMKQQLTSLVQGQLAHTDCVDTKELGEAVDMIKDLAEAIYYCTITDAMEEGSDKKQSQRQELEYYGGNRNNRMMYTPYTYTPHNADMYDGGRMYYTEPEMGGQGTTRNYGSNGKQYPVVRDYKEGMSPITRKMYMESKELNHSKDVQMKELEQYVKELSEDITEMISDATPDEKQLLRDKISTLAMKIV